MRDCDYCQHHSVCEAKDKMELFIGEARTYIKSLTARNKLFHALAESCLEFKGVREGLVKND